MLRIIRECFVATGLGSGGCCEGGKGMGWFGIMTTVARRTLYCKSAGAFGSRFYSGKEDGIEGELQPARRWGALVSDPEGLRRSKPRWARCMASGAKFLQLSNSGFPAFQHQFRQTPYQRIDAIRGALVLIGSEGAHLVLEWGK
jgi:hypothetical protein